MSFISDYLYGIFLSRQINQEIEDNFLQSNSLAPSATINPVAPTTIEFNIQQQQEREALQMQMERITTTKGPELIDFVELKKLKMFKNIKLKEFIKENKKRIKNGDLIVFRSKKDKEKYMQSGKWRNNFYEDNRPIEIFTGSEEQKQRMLKETRDEICEKNRLESAGNN